MSAAPFVPRPRLRFALAAAVGLVLAGPSIVAAQSTPTEPVLRVEEDWLLWVGNADGGVYSPQFHTVMSPLSDLDSYYFQVTWNYRELPEFVPGGFQVQSWNGEDYLDLQNVDRSELSQTIEVIVWTQVLETNGQQIAFSVTNGYSYYWGFFGHPETTIVHDGSFSDLSNYNPDVSAANSWITYGQNRVVFLQIREVRYYGSNGLIRVDPTVRDVFRFSAQ